MKSFVRCMAILLFVAQLFTVVAFADGEVSASVIETMRAAASGGAVPSGVVSTAPGEAESSEAASVASGADDKKDVKKVDYEIAPATQPGTYEDVCIGGLRIVPGVWYTVDSEGVLTSSEPWPDSYLFYSASQSKLTLHEFRYKVPGDVTGKEDTFAALYLPKNMQIVLEGENELVNRSYTKAGGGMSNGVYAPDCVITFTGDGVLKVNTLADESLKGYGIAAGRIRIEGDFIGLSVFGMSGAFNVAPEVNQAREMIVRTGTMHPDYHGGTVRDGNPYDYTVYSRHRYVLFAVGKELNEWEQMRARAYAEAYGAKADFEYQVEYEQAQAWQNFNSEVDIAMNDFNAGMEQEVISFHAEMNNWQNEVDYNFEQGNSDAASQLGRLLMSGGN